jgi:hypothetical protein
MPFVAVTPCRVADTRAGSGFTGDYGQPALQAQAIRSFVISGQCGIPATAQAVSFLFTAVNMTGGGNFRAYPFGTSMPAVRARLPVAAIFLTGGIVVFIARHEVEFLWAGLAVSVVILTLAALVFFARRRLDRASAWSALAVLPRTAPERFYERTCILRTGISAQLAWVIILATAIVFLLIALGFLMSHGVSL